MENMFKVMSLIGEAVWSLWQGLAEVQGKARRPLNLQYWRTSLKKYLQFLLSKYGAVSLPFCLHSQLIFQISVISRIFPKVCC